MKRVLNISLIFCIVISLFTFGVSATSEVNNFESAEDLTWINVLDYATMSGGTFNSNNKTVSSTATTTVIQYNLLHTINACSFDLLISTDGVINGVGGPNVYSGYVIEISDGLYRVYGRYAEGTYTSAPRVTLGISSCTKINVLSFDISIVDLYSVPELGHFWWQVFDTSGEATQTEYFEPIFIDLLTDSDVYRGPYTVDLSCPNWRKYDFVDFYFYGYVESIGTITATFDNTEIPYSVTYLNTEALEHANVGVVVRLDVRGLDKELEVDPRVEVRGTFINYEQIEYFYITHVRGLIEVDSVSPLRIWLLEIKSTITQEISRLIQALLPDQSLDDALNQTGNNIQNDLDQMEWDDIPTMDNFNPDQTIEDSGADLTPIADFFLTVYQIPFIKYGMWISLSFAAAAFVIF